jgi:hypothetical protein
MMRAAASRKNDTTMSAATIELPAHTTGIPMSICIAFTDPITADGSARH